jgi:NAD dependent epimerase/dehydratase family enzyme
MLGVLLPLYRLGLGARLGDGTQVWPWIAAADITPALLHVLERPEIAGPVNFVAPDPVTNDAFTHALAGALGRPSFLRVPAFALRLAPGDMGDEMLLAGARVVPRKLIDSGYAFRFPELNAALRAILRERARN